MKYYSELTKKVYDTEKDLVAAEDEENQKLAVEKEKQQKRAERAKEVEDAHKAVVEAYNHYIELKNKFIDDYKSYHVSYSHKVPAHDFTDFIDWFFSL